MTDITLEQRLRDVLREMDAHCDKLDAIGGGHAAQPIRDFAERIEAALRLSAGADWRVQAAEWLESKAKEQEANNERWPRHAAAYQAWRDRPAILRLLAEQCAAAPRHETGEGL